MYLYLFQILPVHGVGPIVQNVHLAAMGTLCLLLNVKHRQNGYKDCIDPPSEVIKKTFVLSRKQGTILSAPQIKDLAKQTLLPECDVRFWLQHLKEIEERRAEGAKKAKATRQRAKGTDCLFFKTSIAV